MPVHPSKQAAHGTSDAPEVAMPLTPPRDGAGREIDQEQYARLIEKEWRDEFRIERYVAPENPELVAFRVLDRAGHVRGFIGFELDAMEWDLPQRTLERVRRAAPP